MSDSVLFVSAASAVLAGFGWLRYTYLARQQSRQIKSRLGVKSRWDDAFEIDDERLLDPTIDLPERRSMVLFVGDLFDDSACGQELRARLKAADLKIKPSEALGLVVVLGLAHVLFELMLTQGPIISGALAAVTTAIVPWLILRSRRDRRLLNFTRQLPMVAELMANSLRAGRSLHGALELVAREIGDPASEEFALVIREMRLGGSIDDALEALERRMPSADLEVMVTALKVQRIAGGDLIKSMGALSQTLIERQRTQEEIKTMMAEPKYTSYLMPILSLCALALLNRMIPHFLDVLFRTAPGILVLCAFVGLQVLGFILIQRFARIKI
jgi:tight adherence protein B